MKQLNEKVAIVTGAGPDSAYFSGQSLLVDGANSIMP